MITYIFKGNVLPNQEWADCGIMTSDGEIRPARVKAMRPIPSGPLFMTIDLNGNGNGHETEHRRLQNTGLMMGSMIPVEQWWVDRLRDYCHSYGLCETARRTGCSSSALSRILNNQRPSIKSALKTAIDRVIGITKEEN